MAKRKQREWDVYTIEGTNEVVRVGDCVLMRPDATDKPPYVARVERMESDGHGGVLLRVRWYYRPEEAKGGRRPFHGAKELFLSDHFDTQSAHTIEGKCIVHSLKSYTKLDNVGPEDFYCRFDYMDATGAFTPDRVAVYCKCEMPYNPDNLMVQCKGCKDWFHPSCIEMTIEQVKKIGHCMCLDCAKGNSAKRPSNSYPVSPNSDTKVLQTSQGLYTVTVHEGSRYMELNVLERIVNESEEPSPLNFALLHNITEKFAENKVIGRGGCGTVYKGILRNGAVAVKRLHNTRTIKDKMFHREVKSLFSVKHPNIVRLLGYSSFTEEHAIPFEGTIIMADIRERLLCFEYIRNGSLDQHLSDELRGLEWQIRYQIIIGICMGLHYLHKDKEIIHMDLKPGNILLDDLMVPKITDFGLSRLESDSLATTTRLISQGYTAPEYISGGKATSKSDIYSLGVIIIELVTGSRMKPNITKAIRRWNHRWIKSMKQSSLAYQQVKKCLELALRCIQDDPTDRPDISDIIDELKEIDTTYGQTQIQISPCCLEDILGIEPLEICVPFEDLKISHPIELTNDTDDYIAFVTNAKLERFCTEPNRGIVPPRSKCSVTLAMQEPVNAQPKVHYTEVITVLSTRVDGALSVDAMDVTSGEIFIDKEGKVVDEVNMMVVFGMP